MWPRACGLAVVALGCGRVAFDPRADALADPACAGGDSTCLVHCVTTDPDCATACGDGTCTGNAGELCTTCATDCMTRNEVCGNGACDPGERDVCYADCGPSPWPDAWIDDEVILEMLINNARTSGIDCGAGALVTQALVTEPALLDATREWVWEIAHQQLIPAGLIGGCNGRTTTERRAAVSADAAWVTGNGPETPAEALAMLLAPGTQSCNSIASVQRVGFAVAVARDITTHFMVMMLD